MPDELFRYPGSLIRGEVAWGQNFGWYAVTGYVPLREEEDTDVTFPDLPKVSSLELLERVRADAHDGTLSQGLLDEIDAALEAYAYTNQHLTPQRLTEAMNRTDGLFSAIKNITSIAPTEDIRSGGLHWLKCAYCATRSVRHPLHHRAGCAWRALKDAWDNFPSNNSTEPGR